MRQFAISLFFCLTSMVCYGQGIQVKIIDDSKRAQKLYKDARLHIIQGAGHGFKPKEFQEEAAQLEKFLK